LSGERKIQKIIAGGFESGGVQSRAYGLLKGISTTLGPSKSGNGLIP